MASGRMLRAQISLSEQVNDMSLKATLLFTWLIPHVDDFGRILANPKRLKALIFPLRDDIKIDDIKEALIDMYDHKLVTLYMIEDNIYLELVKFDEHQGGLHKRTKSKIPPPEAAFLLGSRKFPEIPGNSKKFPLNRTGIEQEQEWNILVNSPEGEFMSSSPSASLDDAQFFEEKNPQQSDQDRAIRETQRKIRNDALEVLNFLNQKTGRTFRPVDTNLKFIIARLKSGVSADDCRSLIAKKFEEWGKDEQMSQYLRPATLFNATKFEQYIGEMSWE